MSKYFVFVHRDYVRDAQAYLNGELDVNICDVEHEDGWRDAGGDLLIMEFEAYCVNEARHKVHQMYPDANYDVFRVLEIARDSVREVQL